MRSPVHCVMAGAPARVRPGARDALWSSSRRRARPRRMFSARFRIAVQTYASISALLAPRISPCRTTVTRRFSVSATASSPSARLSLSTPPRIARPRPLTHAAKWSQAGASSARQRSSRTCNSPGITRQAPGRHSTAVGPSGRLPHRVPRKASDRSDTAQGPIFRAGRAVSPSSASGSESAMEEPARPPLEQCLPAHRPDGGRPRGGDPRAESKPPWRDGPTA